MKKLTSVSLSVAAYIFFGLSVETMPHTNMPSMSAVYVMLNSSRERAACHVYQPVTPTSWRRSSLVEGSRWIFCICFKNEDRFSNGGRALWPNIDNARKHCRTVIKHSTTYVKTILFWFIWSQFGKWLNQPHNLISSTPFRIATAPLEIFQPPLRAHQMRRN